MCRRWLSGLGTDARQPLQVWLVPKRLDCDHCATGFHSFVAQIGNELVDSGIKDRAVEASLAATLVPGSPIVLTSERVMLCSCSFSTTITAMITTFISIGRGVQLDESQRIYA